MLLSRVWEQIGITGCMICIFLFWNGSMWRKPSAPLSEVPLMPVAWVTHLLLAIAHFVGKLPLCWGTTWPIMGLWVCVWWVLGMVSEHFCILHALWLLPWPKKTEAATLPHAATAMYPLAHRPVSAGGHSRVFKAVDTGELALLLFHRWKVNWLAQRAYGESIAELEIEAGSSHSESKSLSSWWPRVSPGSISMRR